MQRVGVVSFAANVRICAALQQQLHCSFAVAEYGLVQCCLYALAATLVDDLRMPIQQGIQPGEITFSSGIPQRLSTLSAVVLAASSVSM